MFELNARTPAGAAFWVGAACLGFALTADSTEITVLAGGIALLSLGFSIVLDADDGSEDLAIEADELSDEK